ncbi:MAG: carbohydrate ABC transporter permease [Spirochaetes bacterium]|nr:carbohydrate ABC transporter permease [Spirochaetota bacterium]
MMVKSLKYKNIIFGSLLLLLTIPLMSLYVWLLFNSINEKPLYSLIPKNPGFRSWIQLFSRLPEASGMPTSIFPIIKNTIIIAGGVMLLDLFVCSLAGYSISRLKFKGKDLLLSFLLIMKAFPLLILLIATYFVLFYLRLLNTFLSVILARTAMELVMGTWIIKGFFDSIPREIEESARIDGATKFTLWRKIMIPLVKPGLIAVGVMAFIAGWSDFIFVYTFIFDQSKWTLSVFLYSLISSQESVDYNFLATVSIFYMIPTLLLYSFAQKGLTKGTLGGGIK